MIDKKVIKKAADKYLARKIKMINKKFSGTGDECRKGFKTKIMETKE